MSNSYNEIDYLIRNKLLGYEEETSITFWNRLQKKMGRKGVSKILLLLIALMSGLIYFMIIPDTVSEPKKTAQSTFIDESGTETKELQTNDILDVSDITNETTQIENDARKSINNVRTVEKITYKTNNNADVEIRTGGLNNGESELCVLIDFVQESNSMKKSFSLENNNIDPVSRVSFRRLDNLVDQYPELMKLNNDISITDSTEKCKNFSRLSISMEVGYDIFWKKLSSDNEFNTLREFRANNEIYHSNVSYGLKINYQYKNWVISSGIEVTSLSEKLNYSMTETIIDPDGGYYDIDTIMLYIVDQNTNVVPMIIGFEKNWVDEYKVRKYKVENINRYRYIEIPLHIGYQFRTKNLYFLPSIGASVAFLKDVTGMVPVNNSLELEELTVESNLIKPRITNLFFGFSLEYLIYPNYGLYIKPIYKFGMNSLYQDYPLDGNYRNAGLKFGINFYL